MYVLTLPRSLQMREERHSTEWQYTSESVNFGIDSLRMYYCCSVCLFVVCVCVWGGSMRAHPPASIFTLLGVLFTKFFGSIQKLFLCLKGNSLASDTSCWKVFLFPVRISMLNAHHPVDQLACHAPTSPLFRSSLMSTVFFLGLPTPADTLSEENFSLAPTSKLAYLFPHFFLRRGDALLHVRSLCIINMPRVIDRVSFPP